MSTVQADNIASFDDINKYSTPTESICRGKCIAWAHWTNATTGLSPVLQNSYNVSAITNIVRGRNMLTFQNAVSSEYYSGRGMSFDNATSTPSGVVLDLTQANSTSVAYISELDYGTTFTLEGRSSRTSVVLIGG